MLDPVPRGGTTASGGRSPGPDLSCAATLLRTTAPHTHQVGGRAVRAANEHSRRLKFYNYGEGPSPSLKQLLLLSHLKAVLGTSP